MSTKTLLEKADLTINDLATNGGLLEPEQADKFITMMLDAPTILPATRVVRMNAPQRKVNKIGFANRILRPAVSGTQLGAADRSKPTTGQISLNTKEVIAEVHLPYDVIEDNIERGNINAGGAGTDPKPVTGSFKDTIMKLIAERAAIDLEELALLGDTASGDTYLALLDGFLKLSTAHTVDAGGTAISKTLFKNGLKTMPSKYNRNRPAMRHFVSVANELEYRDSLANRDTGLGDAMIEGFRGVFGFGVPVSPTPMMPDTDGLFTNPQNFLWGIQRSISVEVDKDIRARVFIIVLTARMDFKIEEVDAVVRYTNIG